MIVAKLYPEPTRNKQKGIPQILRNEHSGEISRARFILKQVPEIANKVDG
jgi:hypothetical protein